MNKFSFITLSASTILLSTILKTEIALAQGYQMLEPEILTPAAGAQETVSLEKYVSGMYQTMFALILITCIIYLVYGGVSYILTDIVSTKADAKKRITNALYGLGIALVSYLILYIINPDLVEISLDFLSFSSGGPSGSSH